MELTRFNSNFVVHQSLLKDVELNVNITNAKRFVLISAEVTSKLIISLSDQFENSLTEKIVPIFLKNEFEIALTIFALWRLEKIPVVLNPKLTSREMKYIIQNYPNSKIFCDTNIDGIDNERVNFPQLTLSETNGESEINFSSENKISLATSGTSSNSKIVTFNLQNFSESYNLSRDHLNYNSANRWLLSLPLFHVGGLSILMRALFSNASVIFPKDNKFTSLADAMQESPTKTSLVPTQLKKLLDEKVKPNAELSHVLIGGGPSDDESILSAIACGWKIYKVYGSTETTAFVTIMNYEECKNFPTASGKPLKNVEIKIDTSRTESMYGEILISSPTLIQRYDFSDESIIDENGFYHSGDFGFIDDKGFLHIQMRRTDLIISGGENINPIEVENEIIKIDNVVDCAVFGLNDSEWGEVLSALIVLKDGVQFTEEEIKEKLKNALTSFKIPKKYFFTKEIPRTATGKIKRAEIKNSYNLKV